jgi:hypothetical protein
MPRVYPVGDTTGTLRAMAIRIKSKWHHSERNRVTGKALEDNARALAFIIWRLSLEHAKELHRQGYHYASDRERVGVLTEFCAFQLHVCDRLAHRFLDDTDRAALIVALGRRLADLMQDNMVDLAGPGAYRAAFVDALNERMQGYARSSFRDGEPGFDALRYFGDGVLRALGTSQTNRWVLDQVMAVSAPEVHEKLVPAFDNLFATR